MNLPRRKTSGLSIVELLVSLAVVSMVMAGVLSFLVAHRRVTTQEEISVELAANLRIGMRRLSESLRGADYGVPPANLGIWVPWVSGFTTNPRIIDGGGSTVPDSLQTASCTTQPVATLTNNVTAGSTGFAVSSSAEFDTANRRLINIGFLEYAHVTNVGSATTISIDTDLTTTGNQGLASDHTAGTPICRVDVDTYSVDTSNNRLLLDHNDGSGAQILLDGIENLQVNTLVAAPNTYVIVLTARSGRRDPETGTFPTRRMRSAVTLRSR